MLQLRQVWLPTLLDDRIQMQNTIDHLNRHIGHVERVSAAHEANLHHQRGLLEAALKEKEAAIADLKARLTESTRKRDQKKRSVPEKIAREIQRIPKNLQRLLKSEKGKKPNRSGARPKG